MRNPAHHPLTQISAAVICFASLPAIVHLTTEGTNPFHITALIRTTQTILLAALLHTTKKQWAPKHPHPLSSYLNIPLALIIVASTEWAFIVWARQLVHTAVVTAIYETWPILAIYGLNRHTQNTKTPKHQLIALSSLAAMGTLIVTISSSPTLTNGLPATQNLTGTLLATAGSVLTATGLVASIIYAHKLHNRTQPPTQTGHKQTLLHYTLIGLLLGRTISIPLILTLGWTLPTNTETLTTTGIVGAILIGTLTTIGAILIRVVNLTHSPTINSTLLLTPPLSILTLTTLGIHLPRTDLFWTGAALIITTSTLLQTNKQHHTPPHSNP